MIANQIKELREHLDLKPAQFAARLGDKLQRIQDIERGKQKVPEDVLGRILEIFHVSGDWLITGKGLMYAARDPLNPDTIRVVLEEIQAWQVREQRFIDPTKIADVVLTISDLAEGDSAKVKPAAAKVLRLVA